MYTYIHAHMHIAHNSMRNQSMRCGVRHRWQHCVCTRTNPTFLRVEPVLVRLSSGIYVSVSVCQYVSVSLCHCLCSLVSCILFSHIFLWDLRECVGVSVYHYVIVCVPWCLVFCLVRSSSGISWSVSCVSVCFVCRCVSICVLLCPVSSLFRLSVGWLRLIGSLKLWICQYLCSFVSCVFVSQIVYRVATINRLLKIIDLFCRI